MKEIINELLNERTAILKRVDNINTAINALRTVCTHKTPDGSDAFEYNGRDSHYIYYKCSICGEEEKQ